MVNQAARLKYFLDCLDTACTAMANLAVAWEDLEDCGVEIPETKAPFPNSGNVQELTTALGGFREELYKRVGFTS